MKAPVYSNICRLNLLVFLIVPLLLLATACIVPLLLLVLATACSDSIPSIPLTRPGSDVKRIEITVWWLHEIGDIKDTCVVLTDQQAQELYDILRKGVPRPEEKAGPRAELRIVYVDGQSSEEVVLSSKDFIWIGDSRPFAVDMKAIVNMIQNAIKQDS